MIILRTWWIFWHWITNAIQPANDYVQLFYMCDKHCTIFHAEERCIFEVICNINDAKSSWNNESCIVVAANIRCLCSIYNSIVVTLVYIFVGKVSRAKTEYMFLNGTPLGSSVLPRFSKGQGAI